MAVVGVWHLPFLFFSGNFFMASAQKAVRTSARVPRGRKVLEAVLNGVGLEAIAASKRITPKQAEKALRDELCKRWVAPAQDYARLQIARLEAIAVVLKDKATTGHLPTIDRLLRVLDRLDRYHGFSKPRALSPALGEDVRGKLKAKVRQASVMPGSQT